LLQIAATYSHRKAFEALLEAGADSKWRNNRGATVIQVTMYMSLIKQRDISVSGEEKPAQSGQNGTGQIAR